MLTNLSIFFLSFRMYCYYYYYYYYYELDLKIIQFLYFIKFHWNIYWNIVSYTKQLIGCLTLFRMGFFGAAHGWEGEARRPPLPKICHTYPIMMKLGTVIPYLKKIQKLYESRDTPLEFCWHQHFFTGNRQFFLYQEIKI